MQAGQQRFRLFREIDNLRNVLPDSYRRKQLSPAAIRRGGDDSRDGSRLADR